MVFQGVVGAYIVSAFAVIYCDIHANQKMITTIPYTTLEPTPFTPVSLRCGYPAGGMVQLVNQQNQNFYPAVKSYLPDKAG